MTTQVLFLTSTSIFELEAPRYGGVFLFLSMPWCFVLILAMLVNCLGQGYLENAINLENYLFVILGLHMVCIFINNFVHDFWLVRQLPSVSGFCSH